MAYRNILIISDNPYLTKELLKIIDDLKIDDLKVFLGCSPTSPEMMVEGKFPLSVIPYKVKQVGAELAERHDMVISIHCKQLFPPELVNGTKCLNVHPGLNPYNRGWYPQVFAIMNGMPHGATIHEIDVELDHGPIIDQKEVKISADDTSLVVYKRVLEAELELLRTNLKDILNGSYTTSQPENEGNLNMIKDFRELLELDLDEQGTMQHFINKFRALTHGKYKNAYFTDPETGDKIYVSINLERRKDE
ncbi:dTDP-4-amino-4,6-dideoxyglucose formyltransferase [Planctomycetota bacterium]|nr:dTDP-4-amino-4,6-dideoxyglucose formyltransferase [Planctomycetota bacterium]